MGTPPGAAVDGPSTKLGPASSATAVAVRPTHRVVLGALGCLSPDGASIKRCHFVVSRGGQVEDAQVGALGGRRGAGEPCSENRAGTEVLRSGPVGQAGARTRRPACVAATRAVPAEPTALRVLARLCVMQVGIGSKDSVPVALAFVAAK